MPSLWFMRPADPVYEVALALLAPTPPRLDLTGKGPFRISCDDPTFSPDYLDMGLRLVSARLRDVLALDPEQVSFEAVDTSACPAAMQRKGYEVLTPLLHADPFDHDRSTGDWRDEYEGPIDEWSPNAPTVRRWRLDPPDPGKPMRIRWRDDFVPPAPLFAAVGAHWFLATDELAVRVRAAGITDVEFQDLTIDYAPEPYLLLDEDGSPVGPDHPLWNPLVNTPEVLERFELEQAIEKDR